MPAVSCPIPFNPCGAGGVGPHQRTRTRHSFSWGDHLARPRPARCMGGYPMVLSAPVWPGVFLLVPRVSRGLSKFPNRLRYFFCSLLRDSSDSNFFLEEVESNKQKLWRAIAQINYTKCRIKPFENDHFPIGLWARFGLYINKDRETKDKTGGSKNPIPKGFQRIFHWLLNFTTNLSQNPRILDTLKIRPLIISFSYLL